MRQKTKKKKKRRRRRRRRRREEEAYRSPYILSISKCIKVTQQT
jgi:hypothetical protein